MRYATLIALCSTSLAACADVPPPASVQTAPAPISTQVYFYPGAGQSAAQQSRDRYDCYLWAAKQSGFDPSRTSLALPQRTYVQPVPPKGTGTAVGAVTGAAVGAAVSGRHNEGEGAIIGAVAGAVLGAASDASRTAQAQQVQQRYDRRDATRAAALEEQASSYRRAMGACLAGRGYTVQ